LELQLELGSTKRIDEWNSLEACAMPPETAKAFQEYAQDCVKLAEQPNTPHEVREQLLQMAREWMHAVIDKEDGTETPPPE
jgi:hypothetical protein